jgi:hypothetical protein
MIAKILSATLLSIGFAKEQNEDLTWPHNPVVIKDQFLVVVGEDTERFENPHYWVDFKYKRSRLNQGRDRLFTFYNQNEAYFYSNEDSTCVKQAIPTETADLPQALYAIKTKDSLVKYEGEHNDCGSDRTPFCFFHMFSYMNRRIYFSVNRDDDYKLYPARSEIVGDASSNQVLEFLNKYSEEYYELPDKCIKTDDNLFLKE